MDIRIEVGHQHQRKLIAEELGAIQEVAGAFNPPLAITCVVVPRDFDAKVNELQGTTSYTSARRRHLALAKVLPLTDDASAIVLSPLLYTEGWDAQMRMYIYLHEALHVANKQRFPELRTEPMRVGGQLSFMYGLFDEYDAIRTALRILDSLFPTKTDRFVAYVDMILDGHCAALLDDDGYYTGIKEQIALFRTFHLDIDTFLESIASHLDAGSKDIVYAYATIDHYPRFSEKEEELAKSKFVNGKTLALINFFRLRHDGGDTDLQDGLDLFMEFLTNFGVRPEERAEGTYWHVLDI